MERGLVKQYGWTKSICRPVFTQEKPQGLLSALGLSSQPTKAAWTPPTLPAPSLLPPPPPVEAKPGQEFRMAESADWILGTWPQGQARDTLDLGWPWPCPPTGQGLEA